MRKQQGKLGSYNKQYTLYKVSEIPKCFLVWIGKKGPHRAGVGKQANEVCSKQKLSLKTTQERAIMSMSPSQSQSSTVTSKPSGWGEAGFCLAKESEATPTEVEAASGRWRCPLVSVAVADTPLCARTLCPQRDTMVTPKPGSPFGPSLPITPFCLHNLWGGPLSKHYTTQEKAKKKAPRSSAWGTAAARAARGKRWKYFKWRPKTNAPPQAQYSFQSQDVASETWLTTALHKLQVR